MTIARERAGRQGGNKWIFLLPAFVIYVSVVMYPAFYSLYLSFFDWNGVPTAERVFVGLDNYVRLFTGDWVFLVALKNNVLWIVMTLCITVVLALLFAMLLNMRFRGRTVLRGVLYFPCVMSGVMVATTWSWIYHPQLGLLNSFLKAVGLGNYQMSVLAHTGSALIGCFIAGSWHFVGQPMVLFLAGMQTMPQEIIEAAYVDGANALQSFFRIKLPLLKETILIVFATQIISCMKVYDIVYCMTGGGPSESTQTLATWMILNTFSYSKVGYGMAISWIMLLLMLVIIVPYIAYQAKE